MLWRGVPPTEKASSLFRWGVRRANTLTLLATALFLPPLTACSLLPSATPDQPEAFGTSASPDEDVHAVASEWWQELDDPVLSRVLGAALESNFDLQEGIARVDQARAQARVASSVRLPAIRPSVGQDDTTAPANTGLGAQLDEFGLGPDTFEQFGFEAPERIDLATYSIAAGFSYTVDVWGRDGKAAGAAGARSEAAEWDLQAVRMGVLTETAATYLEVVDLRHQVRLAGEASALLQEWEEHAKSQYVGGLADAHSFYSVQQAARNAKSELPRMEARLADAEARLWILVGDYRADLAGLLPETLAPQPSQSPVPREVAADVLMQRPDVRAAEERVLAARLTVGTRKAELLPALSLSGSIGLTSAESGTWFEPDQWFRNLTANVLSPVLQRGRLLGNVEVAEAELNAAVAGYGRSVLTATHEVESALAGLAASHERLELLASHHEAARAEASLRQRRYTSGLDGYAATLHATRLALTAESNHAGGIRDAALARLALHHAVGGAWTE